MVAQDFGADTFLIDGMASHGNSGSPVFSLSADGTRFIGMVTSFASDKISMFDENHQLTAQLPYNSGLARVVRASVIRKALDQVYKGNL
jgi:hypothetical protein